MTTNVSLGLKSAALAVLAAFGTAHAATFKTLHVFSGTDGSSANELIQGSDGNYYGTTVGGGNHDNGVVFRMTTAGVVKSLYVFNGTDGSRPRGALAVGADGNYYGTTASAGTLNGGTAFRITPAGVLTFIHQFGAAGEGQSPTGLITGNDGNFYGTTTFGGVNGIGTLFKMTPAGVVTTLHSFASATDGSMPMDTLTSTGDGNYYGIATNGGSGNCGTLYQVTNAGAFATLYAFTNSASTGCAPQGRLVSGAGAEANLFYGTTQRGGPSAMGSVFKVSQAGVVSWLHFFTGAADGSTPHGGVRMANNFYYYGTTGGGGTYGVGTTFKISTAGAFTSLHSLNPSVAGETTGPDSPLLLDAAGNLIGATAGYSSSTTGGSVFQQTP